MFEVNFYGNIIPQDNKTMTILVLQSHNKTDQHIHFQVNIIVSTMGLCPNVIKSHNLPWLPIDFTSWYWLTTQCDSNTFMEIHMVNTLSRYEPSLILHPSQFSKIFYAFLPPPPHWSCLAPLPNLYHNSTVNVKHQGPPPRPDPGDSDT